MTTPLGSEKPGESAEICPRWYQMGADFASMYPSVGYRRVLAEQAATECQTPDATHR